VCVGGQLLSTADEVAKLQEELELMKPQLADAVQESVVTMQRIAEDTVRQRFTRYLTTILRLSYDNAEVTIDLRRTSNLQNVLQLMESFSYRQDSRAKS